ncbi:hypothetical protein [Parachitinimonas caeni]|uniref:GNAT family N-acetyltransferase n=1 Tax=Parachitinimonas caeni TaxID=3031301 RepID=A0ABT7DW83_9NEIS|nr:hypothetical protein [Parachitinimonas caeni]MDK2124323.1 hypothetical protein [Parachitinimonas caeni]
MTDNKTIDRFIDLKMLNQQANWLSEPYQQALKAIIDCCFSGIDAAAYLQKYFLADDCFARRLRLFFSGEKLVGYCLLTFRYQAVQWPGQNQPKPLTLIGASAGFYPEFRHGNQTVQFSIWQTILYKLAHPQQAVYYADTMLSPAMYRVMAKSVAEVYPRRNTPVPPEIKAILRVLQPDQPANACNFVLPVGRRSDYSAEDLARFAASDKEEIRFFCETNPNFAEGNALLAIMPIHLRQIAATLWRMLRR